ncbi:norbelladine synthase-like [Bidens hawaiensis]|uniref:norbelladine synthase-like n=1 Tax=Bidens hawaiensis TaxID=980011 RepID=UPI004048F5C0
MFSKVSKEMEVKTTISKAWDVYSTLKLAMIIRSELGHLFGIDILEGDGGVDTVIKVTPLSDVLMVPAYKERFTKVDHEKRVKEVEIIEGGYLELGFTYYRIRSEFLEHQKNDSFILRVTFEFEADEEVITNIDTIKLIMNMFEFANGYIESN